MKAKAGSSKVAAKVKGKAPGKALVKAPVKAQAKVPVKATKGAPKGATKPVTKSKPNEKVAIQRAVKVSKAPKVSKTPKPIQKPSGKPMTKTTVKVVAKNSPKVVSKAKPTKVVLKASSSVLKKTAPKVAAKAVTKAATKPATKPVAKVASRVVSKVAPKAAGKTTNPKSAEKAVAKDVTEVLKRKNEPKGSTVASEKVVPPAKPVALVTAVQPAPSAPVLAPKAGRPSSRLAQLTVVGMAQSVASTAAKSSYSQTVALPVIVPSMTMAAKKDPKLANNWKTKPVEQLTDPELLSMPDSEYMNEKQMAVFRLKLSILKQDILNSASDTTEHLREDTVVVPDPADRATIEEEHALELRTRDRERKLLKKIEQSINRIDAGDYGYCDETGEPIGVGRLLARPTATLSLEAQQRRELKQKMFGD